MAKSIINIISVYTYLAGIIMGRQWRRCNLFFIFIPFRFNAVHYLVAEAQASSETAKIAIKKNHEKAFKFIYSFFLLVVNAIVYRAYKSLKWNRSVYK